MLSLSQMNNTDVAAIAAFSSMITAVIASGVSWWNGHHKNEIDENTTLFEAYHSVVENLQSEISRLQSELGLIRSEMQKCEESNKTLSKEIRKLQSCVDKLNNEANTIETMLSIEHTPEIDS
jgi:peptidoglycan hydrolase CwlO-like protein